MKKILNGVDNFIADSDWKTLGMMKACLGSLGIVIGILVPKNAKKFVAIIAGLMFIASYIPLMLKFVEAFTRNDEYDDFADFDDFE